MLDHPTEARPRGYSEATVQFFSQKIKRPRVSSSEASTLREASASGARLETGAADPPPKKKARPFPALGPIPPPPPRPMVPPAAKVPTPAPPFRPRRDTAQPQTSAEASAKQDTGTPAPPPLSQIIKRPARASRSQAPPEEPVEDAKPPPPKKTRTAKHPRTNSKKIVERLQQEWSARVAALPAAFRGEGPPPPLNAAQVNSLREEQEIQVRARYSCSIFYSDAYLFVADGLVRSVYRAGYPRLSV